MTQTAQRQAAKRAPAEPGLAPSALCARDMADRFSLLLMLAARTAVAALLVAGAAAQLLTATAWGQTKAKQPQRSQPAQASSRVQAQAAPGRSLMIHVDTVGRFHREREREPWIRAFRYGGLPPRAIKRVLDRNEPAVRACWQPNCPSCPSRVGEVRVGFHIASNGEVLDAFVKSTTFGDAEVGACAVAAIKRWRFPRSKDGQTTDVFNTYKSEPRPAAARRTPDAALRASACAFLTARPVATTPMQPV